MAPTGLFPRCTVFDETIARWSLQLDDAWHLMADATNATVSDCFSSCFRS